MSDIRRLADRIVSLRDGRITGRFDGPDLDYEGAVDAMLGRKVSAGKIAVHKAGGPIFKVRGLKLSDHARPFDFDLLDGEIVAVTGLVGGRQDGACRNAVWCALPAGRRNDP